MSYWQSQIVANIFVTCDSFHCVYFSLPHSWWRKVKLKIREISIEHHFWLFMIHCGISSQILCGESFVSQQSSLGSFVPEIMQLLNPLTRLTLTGWNQGLPWTPSVRRTFTPLLKNLLLLLLSHCSRVRLCVTPQTEAHQAPPSLGFSRQEHWSGLPSFSFQAPPSMGFSRQEYWSGVPLPSPVKESNIP